MGDSGKGEGKESCKLNTTTRFLPGNVVLLPGGICSRIQTSTHEMKIKLRERGKIGWKCLFHSGKFLPSLLYCVNWHLPPIADSIRQDTRYQYQVSI